MRAGVSVKILCSMLIPVLVGIGSCRVREVPVWVFHGARDNVVPVSDSEYMVGALWECGG
jgi:hypothetical protein